MAEYQIWTARQLAEVRKEQVKSIKNKIPDLPYKQLNMKIIADDYEDYVGGLEIDGQALTVYESRKLVEMLAKFYEV